MLKCLWRGVRSGEIEIVCSLKGEAVDEITPVPAEILSAASLDDGDAYLLRLDLPDLVPGRYALEIEAQDAGGAVLARTSSRLELR